MFDKNVSRKVLTLVCRTKVSINLELSQMKLTQSVLRKFGNVIRQERERQGLSQEKLAELADVHRTYIGMIERAEKNITLVNIEKFSKGLRKPMSYLIKKVEDGPA